MSKYKHQFFFNKDLKNKLWHYTRNIVPLFCWLHCICEYGGEIVVCSGPSMEPTIFSHDIILTQSMRWFKMKIVERGDIVIARSPNCPGTNVCKRVVGLPGDKIPHKGFSSIEVPTGHVWLEGDNTSNSTDSRVYGPVPQGLIKEKVIFRIYPSFMCFTPNENRFR